LPDAWPVDCALALEVVAPVRTVLRIHPTAVSGDEAACECRADTATSEHGVVGLTPQEIQELVREAQVSRLAEPSTLIPALQATGIDPKAQEAFIRQLDAWVSLATFAKWLSAGLAIGSGLFSVFLLSAMT
jgi:hypothetical protein